MPILNWQLTIAGATLRGGTDVEIVDRFHRGDDAYVDLKYAATGRTAQFKIYGNAEVGGKNCLLIYGHNPGDDLLVVRLINQDKIVAMDPDRFSSLQNALNTCIAENQLARGSALEKVLGPLPEKK